MSSTWSDSEWRKRLTAHLEPDLTAPDVAARLSTYQGVPFALFAYPPTVERALRKESAMLATRIEQVTSKRVQKISMAELLWEAIRTALPPDGEDLFETERAFADEPVAERLQRLEVQMSQVLDEIAPISELIRQRAEGLDPNKNILFLLRVGALYPAYRASALLESLMGAVAIPTILFYPGTRSGTNSLRFMDSLDAIHSYRSKIY